MRADVSCTDEEVREEQECDGDEHGEGEDDRDPAGGDDGGAVRSYDAHGLCGATSHVENVLVL